MRYMGGKVKYAKELLEIILANRHPNQWYVEPFVGAGNVIHLVPGPRIASDSNRYMVHLLKAVGEGWIPPTNITVDEYMYAKRCPDELHPAHVGFIGVGAGYGGKFFGGYARGKKSDGTPRNYADEGSRGLLKQARGLADVHYTSCNYNDLPLPTKSVVYCDPPYAGTTKYRDHFDSVQFWNWCDGLVEQGHQVFVSEYAAPEHWQCVWQKSVNSSLTQNRAAKQNIERLFTRSLT